MINIREIDSFIAVCEEQNITAAARRLFISQPALSKTIAQIEKKAGARLFIRNSSGAFLTHEGRIYLEGWLWCSAWIVCALADGDMWCKSEPPRRWQRGCGTSG